MPLWKRTLTKVPRQCDVNAEKAENAVHEVFLNIEMLQKLTEEMNPALFEDLEKYYPAVFEKVYRHKHDFIAQKIEGNMLRGIEQGLYREGILMWTYLSKLRIETMFMAFNQQLFPFGKYKIYDVEIGNH